MHEFRRAARGMVIMSGGQVLSTLIGLIMAVLVPRLFGATDYGHWIYYRSIIVLLVGCGMLGASDVLTRFYMGWKTEGHSRKASHVFKSVMVFRVALACPLGLVGYLLLRSSSAALTDGWSGVFLAGSIMCQTVGLTFNYLIYADRRLGCYAVMSALQVGTTPFAVMLAYTWGDLSLVPLACLLGDFFYLLAAFTVARPWRVWIRGWLPTTEFRSVLLFGGMAAFYALALNVCFNLTPYLMDLRGYDVRAIGFVGFTWRIILMASLALGAIGAGLYPSLSTLSATSPLERIVAWQNTCTRYGVLLLLLALGLFLFVSPWLVPLMLGDSFADAADMIAVAFVCAIPLWMTGQTLRLAMLVKRSSIYGKTGLALLAGFLIPFVMFNPNATGMPVAWAMLCGCVCAQIAALYEVRDVGTSGLKRAALSLCAGLLVVPVLTRVCESGLTTSTVGAALWVLVLFGVALKSKALCPNEFRLMRATMRKSDFDGK